MTFYENVEVGPPTKSNQGAPNETVTPLLAGCENVTKCSNVPEVLCRHAEFGGAGTSIAPSPRLGTKN